MNDVPARLLAVVERIDAACARAGRPPGAVRLLPVTKTHPAAVVRAVAGAGYLRVGENKVQEAEAKAAELADVAGLTWAIIGHLQTNKARQLVGFAAEFQALDSVRVARALQKRCEAAGRRLEVLIEVNSSAEPSKFGVPPQDVPVLARELQGFDALDVRGLMTLAANTPEADVVAACFDRMGALREMLRQDDRLHGDYPELSMGMSNDFELAIERGSTCVRVGTAIFGARHPA